MEYALVVFDRSEDGQDGLFTPYKEKSHLYGNTSEGEPRFIWVHISGEAEVPAGVALRPGWRLATEQDEARVQAAPRVVTYYPNH